MHPSRSTGKDYSRKRDFGSSDPRVTWLWMARTAHRLIQPSDGLTQTERQIWTIR